MNTMMTIIIINNSEECVLRLELSYALGSEL